MKVNSNSANLRLRYNFEAAVAEEIEAFVANLANIRKLRPDNVLANIDFVFCPLCQQLRQTYRGGGSIIFDFNGNNEPVRIMLRRTNRTNRIVCI